MSYVLDALKKAEAERERERGGIPGLLAQPQALAPAADPARGRPLWWMLLGAALVVIAALAAWLGWRSDAPSPAATAPAPSSGPDAAFTPPADTAVAAAPAPAPAVIPPPIAATPSPERPATSTTGRPARPQSPDRGTAADSASRGRLQAGSAGSPEPADATGPDDRDAGPPAAANRGEAPAARRDAGGDARRPQRAERIERATAADPAAPTREPAPRTAQAKPTLVPGGSAAPDSPSAREAARPAEAPAAAAPGPASAPARMPMLAELPAPLRSQIPKLAIGGAMYSDDAANRLLIVNGQVAHEGDKPANGVTLVQIQPRSAILEFRGQRFSVGY